MRVVIHERGPTIYDVARAAGVAASTVSRALRTPDRVSERTREIVVTAARDLGYKPNALRATSNGRLRTVALITSDIANPHYFSIIKGAERRATAAGLLLILVNTEESAHMELRQIDQLSRSVDALILASSRLPDDQLRSLASDRAIVLISRELDGVSSVVLDYAQGAQQVVDHLYSCGHSSVAYLGGPKASWLGSRRWQAIAGAAAKRGIVSTRLGPFSASISAGGPAADAALAANASAIIAHNDLLAMGVMQRLVDRRLRIPADVSVVGFDNIFASEICTPTLTTVSGPHEDMGRFAVELLLEVAGAARSAPRQIVLPSQLIIRGSTHTVKNGPAAQI